MHIKNPPNHVNEMRSDSRRQKFGPRPLPQNFCAFAGRDHRWRDNSVSLNGRPKAQWARAKIARHPVIKKLRSEILKPRYLVNITYRSQRQHFKRKAQRRKHCKIQRHPSVIFSSHTLCRSIFSSLTEACALYSNAFHMFHTRTLHTSPYAIYWQSKLELYRSMHALKDSSGNQTGFTNY
jgi:hypothetical protein